MRRRKWDWTRWMSAAVLVGVATALSGAERAAAQTYPNAIADLRVAKGAGEIAEVWLSDATTRYRHFVLGSEYEAASVSARLRDGKVVKLTLPEDSVFEDRSPRLADLDGDGVDEIVLVRAYLRRGAALAVIGLRNGALSIIAETQAIGTPNRWLNPAGIADFDGDGTLDIAYVQMPHVLGVLRICSLRGSTLLEIASVANVSNHVIGSPHLGLSAVADFDGDGSQDLAIPSRDRKTLRFFSFKGGVSEFARKPLKANATRDFKVTRGSNGIAVEVGVEGGGIDVIGPR